MEEKFENAVKQSKSLHLRPKDDELLKLYALYKQATVGDNTEDRPTGFDFKGAAKYDAWRNLKGKSINDSMNDYISFVNQLVKKYA